MMIRSFFSAFLFLFACALFSQEGLKPLNGNINLIYKDLHPNPVKKTTDVSSQKTASVSIQLPFVEDFFYAPYSHYPDQSKWSDSLVYVNTGFPIAPPSLGVATFDGLNKNGYPYNPTLTNLTIPNPADKLTSQPVNLYTSGQQTLDPYSGVGISFYYQARGNGDPPELPDSLILDFFKPRQNKWQSAVWFSQGSANSNTNDTAFKRAYVPIKDTAYLADGFKFRFRNWASVVGDFDHWNLDYIFLDKNRDTLADTVRNDITFGNIPTTFLRSYSEMPYQQFQSSEMATNAYTRIRNNSQFQVNMGYKYRVYDNTHSNMFYEYDGGFKNLNPFWKNAFIPAHHGYSSEAPHALPPVNYTFSLPASPVSFNYEIKHFIFLDPSNSNTLTSSDILKQNDTVSQYQFFRDFYAFDDGSAEQAYYINSAGATMAVKVQTNVLDTLKALRIYFDPVGDMNIISGPNSIYTFTLYVWGLGANGGPGLELLKDSSQHRPIYSDKGFKEIQEFKFKHPPVLGAGTYFIGLKQSSGILNIGFDANYDHKESLYYNLGTGWKQSEQKGSIMMRPLFSDRIQQIVGLKEQSFSEKNKFLVYPNPSSEQFTIFSSALNESSFGLYNSLGQLVTEGSMDSTGHAVSTSGLNPGIYILVLKNKGQAVQQQKIIVQH